MTTALTPLTTPDAPAYVTPTPAGGERLRVVPAPPHDPPYDDEPAAPVLRLVRDLAPRDLAPRDLASRDLAPRPARAPVPSLVAVESLGRYAADEPAGPTATGLPDARRAAQALVQGLLEVRGGVRPVAQLQRDTTPELFAQLEQALLPTRRRGRPRAAAAHPAPTVGYARAVLSVHVQERPDGVAEVCATVLRAGRAGALALRLEGQRGRWVCTAVAGL